MHRTVLSWMQTQNFQVTVIIHLHTFSASIALTFKDCAKANLSLSSITILLGGRTAETVQ